MTTSIPLPTDAELRVLQVLWARGPQTVRAIHDQLVAEKDVRYTTVLKILQNMRAKRLVRRDDSVRSHVFEAAVDEEWASARYVADLTGRVFQGSTTRLVLRALSAQRASPEDLEQIRELLERLEAGP